MKRLFELLITFSLISSGVGSLLFIFMWIEHDFEYAWDQFEILVKKAL